MGVQADGNVPSPPRERGPWLLALALLLVCCGAIAAVMSGAVGSRRTPPPLPAHVATPRPAATILDRRTGRRIYASATRPSKPAKIVATAQAGAQRPSFAPTEAALAAPSLPISRRWIEGFYPIYEQAQKAFGVNWLLIASIHRQESAFSTAPTTYHGLNFAGCCGGPMQFNVTDGPPTTWALVADSYRYGRRPARYDHRTARHPSIYDDFDSIMAAAHLLSLDGAGYALDDSAWWAAYDYYGHDAYGVLYADQVLARAIGWSQHGFCVNCAAGGGLVGAVQAAYGAPVLAQLRAAARLQAATPRTRRRRRTLARSARRRPGRSRR